MASKISVSVSLFFKMYRVNNNQKLNDALKGSIITLSNRGVSNKQISRELGISMATVRLWINRFIETDDIKRKQGSGGHRITTPAEDQRILDAIEAQPITTARDIASNTKKIIFTFTLIKLNKIK